MNFKKLFSKSSNDDEKDFSKEYKIVHDLKNPLNGIYSMSQLLRRTKLNDEQMEYLNLIDKSIKNMLIEIDRISSAEIDSKIAKEVEFVEIEPRIFIQEVYSKLSSDGIKENISYKIENNFPFRMIIDLNNLNILIEKIYELFFENKDLKIRLELKNYKDGSIGIFNIENDDFDDESAKKISKNDFFDDSLNFYCDGLEFRCEVFFDKKLNHRANIYFDYNRDFFEQMVFAPAGKEKLILVAEDEVVGRMALKLILKDEYNVMFARNGREALELYFSQKPDLVLMDIMMPKFNGFQAFDEIEKKDPNRCPIVACTSKVISKEREYLTSYGFDDHLDKPINIDSLNKILKKYFEWT